MSTRFNMTGTGGTNVSSSFCFVGEHADLTVSARNARRITGRNGLLTFTVTGTDATMQIQPGAVTQPFDWWLDSGSGPVLQTRPTFTANVWNTFTVLSGATDQTYTVLIQDIGTTDALGPLSFDKDDTIDVTGSAPAIGVPANYESTARIYQPRSGTTSNYIVPEGGMSATGNQSNLCYTLATYSDSAFRFRATIATLSIFGYLDGSHMALWIDGVQQAPITRANTAKWGVVTISTTLDATAEHEYVFQHGKDGAITWGFITSGGTGINNTTLTARPIMAFYGDSITAGMSGSTGASVDNWVFMVGMGLRDATAPNGYQVANRGIGGVCVHNYGAGGAGCQASSLESHTAIITGLPTAPSRVFVMGGVNDILGAGCNSGNVLSPTSAFQTSYRNMLDALRTGLSSARIDCHPIMVTCGNSGRDSTNTPDFNTNGVQLSITNKADGNIFYCASGSTSSTLHPGRSDSITIAANIVRTLNPGGPYPFFTDNAMSGGLQTMSGQM